MSRPLKLATMKNSLTRKTFLWLDTLPALRARTHLPPPQAPTNHHSPFGILRLARLLQHPRRTYSRLDRHNFCSRRHSAANPLSPAGLRSRRRLLPPRRPPRQTPLPRRKFLPRFPAPERNPRPHRRPRYRIRNPISRHRRHPRRIRFPQHPHHRNRKRRHSARARHLTER